eukprot:1507447-Rhodomonas_salina.2
MCSTHLNALKVFPVLPSKVLSQTALGSTAKGPGDSRPYRMDCIPLDGYVSVKTQPKELNTIDMACSTHIQNNLNAEPGWKESVYLAIPKSGSEDSFQTSPLAPVSLEHHLLSMRLHNVLSFWENVWVLSAKKHQPVPENMKERLASSAGQAEASVRGLPCCSTVNPTSASGMHTQCPVYQDRCCGVQNRCIHLKPPEKNCKNQQKQTPITWPQPSQAHRVTARTLDTPTDIEFASSMVLPAH